MNSIAKFHISDVLSVTTGYLVSTRHIQGVYDILNHMTGENLFTHMLPAASDLCQPRLREQFPDLMKDSEKLKPLIIALQSDLATATREAKEAICNLWWKQVQDTFGLAEYLTVETL